MIILGYVFLFASLNIPCDNLLKPSHEAVLMRGHKVFHEEQTEIISGIS